LFTVIITMFRVFLNPIQHFRGFQVLTRIVILAGLLSVTGALQAQSEPTASRVGDLKVGGGVSSAASDYGGRYNGGAAYVNLDFLPHIGVEGEFHFVKDANDLYEKTYEVGGRYFFHHRRLSPYVKVMYGRGVFNFPEAADGFRPNLAYNIMAGGIGTDYIVKPYLVVRADWEYQSWFGFENSSLSPNILTLGAAYRFPARRK
jgi:Outer membrane protein beta-barrel domain